MKIRFLGIAGALACAGIIANPTAATAGDTTGRTAFPNRPWLRQFDKDQDGKLDAAERKAARQAWEKRRGGAAADAAGWPGRAEVIRQFDKNKDGTLDKKERQAALEARQKQTARGAGARPVAREILKKFDKNGNGRLDDGERAAMKKVIAAKFDADHDGKLDETERAAVRKALLGADPAAPPAGRRDPARDAPAAGANRKRGGATRADADARTPDRTRARRADAAAPARRPAAQRRREGGAGRAAQTRAKQMQSAMLRIYDLNGNGRLDPPERALLREDLARLHNAGARADRPARQKRPARAAQG